MFSLIPLTIEDSGVLEQIHAACFPDAWNREAFDQLLTEPLTCGWICVSLDRMPVGFILARVVKDEAEILTFGVYPSFQRKGAGRYLLKQLMDFLKSVSCTRIFLEVAIDNEVAIALYTSVGFVIIGTRPKYYKRLGNTSVSASLMTCQL